MGNCLRGNQEDFEVSEGSVNQRSSSRSHQQHHFQHSHQQQQQQQQQQPLNQQQTHDHSAHGHQAPCRHHHHRPGRHHHQQQQAQPHQTTVSVPVPPATAAAAATAFATPAGKNQPLRRERIRWSCEHPLTAGQLRAKRDEFWDTAPAFDGRREIWDALRAAAAALESGDHELAQAILNGAGVTLPRGLLTDSYDELGTRYQLPLYVLTAPANLADSPAPSSKGSVGSAGTAADAAPEKLKATVGGDSEAASQQLHLQHQQDAAPQSAVDSTPVTLKLRLSLPGLVPGGRDIRMQVASGETVARAKRALERKVAEMTGGESGTQLQRQRWYCYGRQLTDKMRVSDCPIPRGFVVQVVLGEAQQQPQQPQQQTIQADM